MPVSDTPRRHDLPGRRLNYYAVNDYEIKGLDGTTALVKKAVRINWSLPLEMGVALVDGVVLTIDTVEKCTIPAAVLSVYRFMKAIEDL